MMDCAAVRGGSRGAGAGRGGRNRRGPHTPSISTGRNKPLARRPRRAYFYRVFATQSPKNKDKKGPQAPTQQMTHSVTYCCVGGRVAGGGGGEKEGDPKPLFFLKRKGGLLKKNWGKKKNSGLISGHWGGNSFIRLNGLW